MSPQFLPGVRSSYFKVFDANLIQKMTWEQMKDLVFFSVFNDLSYMKDKSLQDYHETAIKRAKESTTKKDRRVRKKKNKVVEEEAEQDEQSRDNN